MNYSILYVRALVHLTFVYHLKVFHNVNSNNNVFLQLYLTTKGMS